MKGLSCKAADGTAYTPGVRTDVDWTEALIERLRVLWAEGHSAAEIARRLGQGVTKNAVVGKARRLGLEARPSPIKRHAGGDHQRTGRPRKPRPVGSRPTLPALGSDDEKSASVLALVVAPAALPTEVFTMSGRIRDASDARRDTLRGPTLATTEAASRALRLPFAPTNMMSRQFPPDHKCMWPIGEPKKPGFRFCAAVVEVAGPYCTDCRKRAYATGASVKAEAA